MDLRTLIAGTAAGAAVLLLGASHAAALNRVVNGNFDDADQVDGWTEVAAWSAADWQGDPSSGSLVNTAPDGFAANTLSRYCASVTPGEQIDVRAHARIAPGQAAGQVTLRLVFWTNGCGTSAGVSNVASDPIPKTGNWELVSLGTLDVPATAHGAEIQFTVAKTAADGSLTAHLDHVFLPEPDGALGDAAVLASLASLARVSRGRRRRAACPGAACGDASSRPPAPPRPCARRSGA
jgi:hypothetical protein